MVMKGGLDAKDLSSTRNKVHGHMTIEEPSEVRDSFIIIGNSAEEKSK